MNLKILVLSIIVSFLLAGTMSAQTREDWQYFISGINYELFEKGIKQMEAGRLEHAAETFFLLTERMPTRFSPYFWLAGIYDQLGEHEKTIETCNKIRYRFSIIIRRFGNPVYKNPIYSQFYFTLGTAYFERKSYREAAEAFERLLKAGNYERTEYANLKKFYPACGVTRDAFYAMVHYRLGAAYVSLGKPEAAMEQYKELQKSDAKKAEALFKIIKKK